MFFFNFILDFYFIIIVQDNLLVYWLVYFIYVAYFLSLIFSYMNKNPPTLFLFSIKRSSSCYYYPLRCSFYGFYLKSHWNESKILKPKFPAESSLKQYFTILWSFIKITLHLYRIPLHQNWIENIPEKMGARWIYSL